MDEPPGSSSTPAGVLIHMWSREPDAIFERATKAGAKVTMPLEDMFWGDRYGQLVDGSSLLKRRINSSTPEWV
jgi:uncharacterized glyoxalase superfamily protein PhnB